MSQTDVLKTLNHPDLTTNNKETTEYQKKLGNQTVTVLLKQNKNKENIIISCWIDPPNYGTKDYKDKKRYLKMQEASPFKKFWLILLQQLGF